MNKKVVISTNAKEKVLAFFDTLRAKKEEAKKRSEARTAEVKSQLLKTQAK